MVRVAIPLFGKALGHTFDRIALAPKAGCLRPIKDGTDSLADRRAVSGLDNQIGVMTLRTSPLPIWSTRCEPITGKA